MAEVPANAVAVVEKMQEIASRIRGARLRYATEKALQDDLERLLQQAEIDHVRECRLPGCGIVDFRTVDGIGIECKVSGSTTQVVPQFQRYCESREIAGLLVVTSRARHRWPVNTLCGKPFAVVWVGGCL